MVNQTPEKTVGDDIDKQLDAAGRIVHAKNIDLAANKSMAGNTELMVSHLLFLQGLAYEH